MKRLKYKISARLKSLALILFVGRSLPSPARSFRLPRDGSGPGVYEQNAAQAVGRLVNRCPSPFP